MRFRLTPLDTSFYDLYAKSASHLVEGAKLLTEVLADGNDRAATAKQMKDAEHRCDEVTHEIIRRVNSTFVTPFDREDMYRLTAGLDDVMDDMEAAVNYAYLYEIESLPAGVEEQVDVLQRAADLTADAMPRLRTMRDLEEYWIEIKPTREHWRPDVPSYPGQPFQRLVRRVDGAATQRRHRAVGGRNRLVRTRRQHRRADRSEGIVMARTSLEES